MKELSFQITGVPTITLPSGVPTQNLSTILSWAIELLTIIGIIMALGFLIYAGVQWVTSEGDKQKLQTARDSVKYTVLGLIIIFVSFLFINILAYFFQIPLLGTTPTIPAPTTRPCRYTYSSRCTRCEERTYYSCNSIEDIRPDINCTDLCNSNYPF